MFSSESRRPPLRQGHASGGSRGGGSKGGWTMRLLFALLLLLSTIILYRSTTHRVSLSQKIAKTNNTNRNKKVNQMTRSSEKSAYYQGKPHIGSSETWDPGCRFVLPKASDCGCSSRPANPRISRYAGFPDDPATQVNGGCGDLCVFPAPWKDG